MQAAVVAARVNQCLARLEAMSSEQARADLLRYGIVTGKAMGVGMAAMQRLAAEFGTDHELALALWQTGWYEARTVAVFVADPDRVTTALMNRWCRDFDNWGICDTACFKLFDRTPHAFRMVEQWAGRRGEFQRRAAFALLASLALHDKQAADSEFLRCLPLIEAAAPDGRNFVKKGVSWALRAIGRRPSAVSAEARALASRLADSDDPAARWIGRDACRDFARSRAAAAKRAK